jgi:hypothetical protein
MAQKKTAKKETTVTADEMPVQEYDATRYTPWTPGNMPVGGKSNSTEQLNDHPTEHNHSAEAISDIVDRFADLRLYVPTSNSCGVDGDLKVDGNSDLKINVPADFWSQASGTVFHPYGMIGGSQGAFNVAMTSNGYRNSAGKWTSLGIDGKRGATQIGLLPAGVFEVRTAGDWPTGSGKQPDLRLTVDDVQTKAFGGLQVDGQTLAQNGTKTAPGYSFTSDPDTGIYLYTAGITSITCAGKNVANFGSDGVAFPEGLAEITGTAANLHIGENGQIRRITDVAKAPTNADLSRLETVIETLTARIEELEARLKPAATDV